MSGLKQLIHEIHRRSLWQVLGIYVAVSWVVFQVVQTLTEGLGLPGWVPPLAFVLLLIGLPVVMATAFVQEGIPVARRSEEASSESESEADAIEGGVTAPRAEGARRLFTWRNAILAGVLAFALLGVVTTGYMGMRLLGIGPVGTLAAKGVIEPGERIVLADFENHTSDSVLALTVTEALRTDLSQSRFVRLAEPAYVQRVLARMESDPDAPLDAELAREVAIREGLRAVIDGKVTPAGTGYVLAASLVAAATGEVLAAWRETAEDATGIILAIDRLSNRIRERAGESLRSVRRSRPLPSVTTGSLDALQLYARAVAFANRGAYFSAIPLLQQAVELDTAFALAYRLLGINLLNTGNSAASQVNIDQAYRYAERLLPWERYVIGAQYHAHRGRRDSAVYFYRLALDRDPDLTVALNNLGDLYERMGRYEEAFSLYQRAGELGGSLIQLYNVASAARTLGRHQQADSILAVMRQRYQDNWFHWRTEALNAVYASDVARVIQIGRDMGDSEWPFPRSYGRWLLASSLATQGQIGAALALADSAAELAVEAGSPGFGYTVLRVATVAAFAAGAPARALPHVRELQDPAFFGGAFLRRHRAWGLIATAHALAGDLAEARRLLASMDSLVEAFDFRPLGFGEHVRAIIALQEGRAEASLEHLRRARAAQGGRLTHSSRLLLGDAYVALDRLPEAAAQYDTLTRTYRLNISDVGVYGPLLPLAHERLASVYIAVGDTVAAVKHLSTFLELWKDADPELQPRVEAARRAISALSPDQ